MKWLVLGLKQLNVLQYNSYWFATEAELDMLPCAQDDAENYGDSTLLSFSGSLSTNRQLNYSCRRPLADSWSFFLVMWFTLAIYVRINNFVDFHYVADYPSLMCSTTFIQSLRLWFNCTSFCTSECKKKFATLTPMKIGLTLQKTPVQCNTLELTAPLHKTKTVRYNTSNVKSAA